MLAHTGDADFNRHMRQHAVDLDMHLNEYGLWKRTDDNGEWMMYPLKTEQDIFDFLLRDYVEPTLRNYSNLNLQVGKKKSALRKEKDWLRA